MRVIKSVGLILLGVILGIAASAVNARVEAQASQFKQTAPQFIQPGPENQHGQSVGSVITGENIGFQLIATPTSRGDVATGMLMIKFNGRWLPAAAPTGPMPAVR